MRLDIALVQRGLCSSRARAKTAIEAGLVAVNGNRAYKPSVIISESDALVLQDDDSLRYVSRGALKLLRALDYFQLDVTGLTCLDVGASTGGFTQVLLERGASRVTAVDVGTAQLAQALREDPRVASLEQTDIRTLSIPPMDFCCVDVSFISLKLVLPSMFALLRQGACAICLVKPQFEVGPARVGKHGLVKDQKAQAFAIAEVIAAAQQAGFAPQGLTYSPVLGGVGNVEFLLHLTKSGSTAPLPDIAEIVNQAGEALT